MKQIGLVKIIFLCILSLVFCLPASALDISDLSFGDVVPLPVSSVNIDIRDTLNDNQLLTTGRVDFAVAYAELTGVYTYVYQITNAGGGLGYDLSLFSLVRG